MAAAMGLSPENLEMETACPAADTVTRRLAVEPEVLMGRLRGRCNQHKAWTDSIKAVRMAVMSDKRYQPDALDRPQLQACLDRLHSAMKVVSQQSLIERLESIARQLSMTFSPPTVPENTISLSTEMFHVEIFLDGQGGVKDVKIGHQESPSSCEELTEVLSKGDFDEFISHLEGLLGIYKISGDKKHKLKAYLALCSLEGDLNVLAQLQSSINGVANYIHKSPLGILLPRKGGHPMKLIYFVSPYDLLCKKTRSSYPMTVEAITEHGLGHSVTVCLEPGESNRLQTMPLMSVKAHAQDGKRLPSFQALNNVNSYSLPASFVLVLPQPIPLASSVVRAVQEITGIDVVCGEEKSLMSLLLECSACGKISDSSTELYVTLPDQQHVYYLNNLEEGCLGQTGVCVTRIPFTHPTNVPKVLNLLRQQLLFNTVVQSLVRPAANRDPNTSIVFELTAVSLQYLSVMFEHPLCQSMVTVELDLSDITSVKCHVCTGCDENDICSDDFVSKAFQRCCSIPVTLRTVIQKVREEIKKLVPPEPVLLPEMSKQIVWPKDRGSNIPNIPVPAPLETWGHNPYDHRKYPMPMGNRGFLEPLPPDEAAERPPANPLLATLLDQGSPPAEAPPVNDSPMLSKLLEEHTSVASDPPAFPAPKQKRIGKRKSSKDQLSGRSPKHRLSESEMNERDRHVDLDSSGGSVSDSDHPVRPASASSVGSVGHMSSTGSIIDLTDARTPEHMGMESHVKKLEDFIIQKESRMNKTPTVGGEMSSILPEFHHDGVENRLDERPRSTGSSVGSQSSPHHGHVPKNGKASTSLEGCLIGSGESRESVDPNTIAAHGRRNSQLARMANFKRQNSVGRNSVESLSGGVSPDIVFSPTSMLSPSHSHYIKMEPGTPLDSKAGVMQMGGYDMSASISQANMVMNPAIVTSSGKPSLHTLKAHYEIKNEIGVFSQEKDLYKTEESSVPPLMKLKLSAMKQYDSVSPPESEDSKSRTSAFDFHSDEDEFLPSLEKSLTVVSASPTRLQISNKSKTSHNFKFSKSEKYKRKESKHNSVGEPGKRKREKEEGRKERKKKRNTSGYSSASDQAVYKSTTVAVASDGSNDLKTMPKLKITKSGVKVSVNSVSDSKSDKEKDKNMHSRSVSMDQGIFDKLESMKNEHISKNSSMDGYSNSKKNSSKGQKLHKSHQRSASSSAAVNLVTVNKSDSKLMTRTPTIKLKPIVVPVSSSGGNTAGSRTPSSPVVSTPTPARSVAASPTSTTIGKIGAVSLATSGTQKSLSSTNTSKSPQGPGKLTNSSTKSSASSAMSSKSTGSLQKSGSMSGSGMGKNSPMNTGKAGSAAGRSSSASSLSQGSSKSSGISGRNSGKTSSPVSGGKRTSSSGGRDKSTSLKNSMTPATTVITQKTAASMLSFLNPKASSIASLPPIPKLSSAAGNSVKNSASSTASTTTSATLTGATVTAATSSVKASQSVSTTSSGGVNKGGSAGTKAGMQLNSAGQTRTGSLSNASASVGNRSGTQSPVNYSNKGSSNKGPSVTPAAGRGSSSVPFSRSGSSQPVNSVGHYGANRGSNSTPAGTGTASSAVSKPGQTSSGSAVPGRGSSINVSSPLTNSVASSRAASTVTSTANNAISNKGHVNSSSNGPKGPGPPASAETDESVKSKQTLPSQQSQASATGTTTATTTAAAAAANASAPSGPLTAAARGRKGSLSAVIDKLTCKATTTVSSVEKEQPTGAAGNVNSSEEKTDEHLVNTVEKKGRSKSEGGVSSVSVDCQVNNSTSVSPLKENPKAASNNGHTKSGVSSEHSNNSTSVTAKTGNTNPVLSKSDTNTGGSHNLSKCNSLKEGLNSSQPASMNKAGPAVDPVLQSVGTGSRTELTVTPNCSNTAQKEDNRIMENNKCKNSIKQSGDILKSDSVEINHVDKSRGGSSIGPGKAESPDKSGKSKNSDCSGSKQLSSSASAEDKAEKARDTVFKVPTPKPPAVEEKDQEDIENLVVRRKVRSNSKPIPSPGSPCSSPENGLIIDCPSSPRHLQNKTNSPQCNPASEVSVQDGRPLNWKSVRTCSPKLKPSPIHSPSGKDGSNPGSVANVNSPCFIDDDLMEEALGIGS